MIDQTGIKGNDRSACSLAPPNKDDALISNVRPASYIKQYNVMVIRVVPQQKLTLVIIIIVVHYIMKMMPTKVDIK